jgi:hypothetical protein
MSRDRDIRLAMQTLLQATAAFDPGGVVLTGLPEALGQGTSLQALATIDPLSTTQDFQKVGMGFDDAPGGSAIVDSTVTLTLIYRHEDAELRDEGVELLLDTALNALSGQCLATITMPAFTRFTGWKWDAATPPERRITATFTYSYFVDGWTNYDVTP